MVGQFARSNPADLTLGAAIDAGASAALLFTVFAAHPGTEDAKTEKYRSKLVEAVGLGNQALFEQVVSEMEREKWAPAEANARYASLLDRSPPPQTFPPPPSQPATHIVNLFDIPGTKLISTDGINSRGPPPPPRSGRTTKIRTPAFPPNERR